MAWMEILSPHNGRPVRVRDKDVGRSVRDCDGKIFFVLEREQPNEAADGDSVTYYGSLTRVGGAEQEKKYDDLAAKQTIAREVGQQRSEAQVHDATGSKRSNPRGKLLIFALFIAMLGVIVLWLFTLGPLGNAEWQKTPLNSRQVDSQGKPETDSPRKDSPDTGD